jgi:hypothetical protein
MRRRARPETLVDDPIESAHHLIVFAEHDLRANALRLSRGKSGPHFSGSCSTHNLTRKGRRRLVATPESVSPMSSFSPRRVFRKGGLWFCDQI